MTDIPVNQPVDQPCDPNKDPDTTLHILHTDTGIFPPSESRVITPSGAPVICIPPGPHDVLPVPTIGVPPNMKAVEGLNSILGLSPNDVMNSTQLKDALHQNGYTDVPHSDKGQVTLKPGDVLIGERKGEIKPAQGDSHSHTMMYVGTVDGKPAIVNYDNGQKGAGLKVEPLNTPTLSEAEKQYGFSNVTVLRAPEAKMDAGQLAHNLENAVGNAFRGDGQKELIEKVASDFAALSTDPKLRDEAITQMMKDGQNKAHLPKVDWDKNENTVSFFPGVKEGHPGQLITINLNKPNEWGYAPPPAIPNPKEFKK